jgi:uncharacterized membrane protein (UPF0127 family)
MKKFVFQISALLVVIFILVLMQFNSSFSNAILPNLGLTGGQAARSNTPQRLAVFSQSDPSQPKALIKTEYARTKEERARGLGGRASLDADSGMLFIFEQQDKYRFWMKDMRFPLDIVWIRGDEIVDITKNVPPPTSGQTDNTLPIYTTLQLADKVLEVNSGFTSNHNIEIGDKIKLVNQ